MTLIPVPPPDTVPRSIYERQNWATASWITGTFVARTLQVRFKAGTSAAVRSTLLEHVGARVIGGRRDRGDDGLYFVQIAAERDFRSAYQLLQASDAVEFVAVVLIDAVSPAGH
jgi:hypothetical protein